METYLFKFIIFYYNNINDNKDIRELDNVDNISSDKKRVNQFPQQPGISDDYHPIQKNTKLLKFILYTTKVEIKANSFMRMIYGISILELLLWFVAFLLFCSSPTTYYLVWAIIFHVGRGILGLILITNFPKTYEILENLSKNPNFEEDRILDMIQEQLKETFSARFTENKTKLVTYLVFSCLCLVIDFIIFWVQMFNNNDNYALMQISFMFIITVFLGKDNIFKCKLLMLFTSYGQLPLNLLYRSI